MNCETLNIEQIFSQQKQHQFIVGNTTYKQRIALLQALKKALTHTFKQDIRAALMADFNKPALEVDLTEIYPIVSEINYVCKHLKKWLKPKHVATPWVLVGACSKVIYEPKGVCLIISPWNFPFNLSFTPLISALAAGNTVILKPSELTPHSSALIARIVAHVFQPNEVGVVQGGVDQATVLLKQPFNHIFFTGSATVGKIVMEAAAKHLSSITLELGGKSPVIIDQTADLKLAAKRVMWGKFLNNGQICVAPDYILIHHTLKQAFIALCKEELNRYYTNTPQHSPDYCRIVNTHHFNRLIELLKSAQQAAGEIVIGGTYDASQRYIAPTLLSISNFDNPIMAQEIFGPILPLLTYSQNQEVVDHLNRGHKPLAMYVYSKNKQNIQFFYQNTRCGSAAVNHNILQYSNPALPFGGSNHSGMGKSHGIYGFEEFSNKKSMLTQSSLAAIDTLFPPYTKIKQAIMDFTLKWF